MGPCGHLPVGQAATLLCTQPDISTSSPTTARSRAGSWQIMLGQMGNIMEAAWRTSVSRSRAGRTCTAFCLVWLQLMPSGSWAGFYSTPGAEWMLSRTRADVSPPQGMVLPRQWPTG